MQNAIENANPPSLRPTNEAGGYQALMMTESIIPIERSGPNGSGSKPSHVQRHTLRENNVVKGGNYSLAGFAVNPQPGYLPHYPLYTSHHPMAHPHIMHQPLSMPNIPQYPQIEKMICPPIGNPLPYHPYTGAFASHGLSRQTEQEGGEVSSSSSPSSSSSASDKDEDEGAAEHMRQQAHYAQYMQHMMYRQYVAQYYNDARATVSERGEEMSTAKDTGGSPYNRRENKDSDEDELLKDESQVNFTRLADPEDEAELTQDDLLKVVTSYAQLKGNVPPPAKQLFKYKGPRTYKQKSIVLALLPEQHDILYALASCCDVNNSAAQVKKEVKKMLEDIYKISSIQFGIWFKNRYRPSREVKIRKLIKKKVKKEEVKVPDPAGLPSSSNAAIMIPWKELKSGGSRIQTPAMCSSAQRKAPGAPLDVSHPQNVVTGPAAATTYLNSKPWVPHQPHPPGWRPHQNFDQNLGAIAFCNPPGNGGHSGPEGGADRGVPVLNKQYERRTTSGSKVKSPNNPELLQQGGFTLPTLNPKGGFTVSTSQKGGLPNHVAYRTQEASTANQGALEYTYYIPVTSNELQGGRWSSVKASHSAQVLNDKWGSRGHTLGVIPRVMKGGDDDQGGVPSHHCPPQTQKLQPPHHVALDSEANEELLEQAASAVPRSTPVPVPGVNLPHHLEPLPPTHLGPASDVPGSTGHVRHILGPTIPSSSLHGRQRSSVPSSEEAGSTAAAALRSKEAGSTAAAAALRSKEAGSTAAALRSKEGQCSKNEAPVMQNASFYHSLKSGRPKARMVQNDDPESQVCGQPVKHPKQSQVCGQPVKHPEHPDTQHYADDSSCSVSPTTSTSSASPSHSRPDQPPRGGQHLVTQPYFQIPSQAIPVRPEQAPTPTDMRQFDDVSSGLHSIQRVSGRWEEENIGRREEYSHPALKKLKTQQHGGDLDSMSQRHINEMGGMNFLQKQQEGPSSSGLKNYGAARPMQPLLQPGDELYLVRHGMTKDFPQASQGSPSSSHNHEFSSSGNQQARRLVSNAEDLRDQTGDQPQINDATRMQAYQDGSERSSTKPFRETGPYRSRLESDSFHLRPQSEELAQPPMDPTAGNDFRAGRSSAHLERGASSKHGYISTGDEQARTRSQNEEEEYSESTVSEDDNDESGPRNQYGSFIQTLTREEEVQRPSYHYMEGEGVLSGNMRAPTGAGLKGDVSSTDERLNSSKH
ncbi:hypothetical protein CEUSTIGMA_g4236.t1 [Chlamydomonas eustigma]|uniref:Uncharacterized protein n=1 Tax=Chlamydomonas eustigma TaxID=1157962 RepID=A0A250X220_9CHLO|nr:hypothetical protein CEUSTIGMA_g4236.t1 [Chlamydomonas eustigma]|eukprot:GAX76790.1 hypothetical protein CEUSTIGMA_g4236.t1 [Chlamydomonas eustigma]